MKRTALARKTPSARTPFPQRHPAEVAAVSFKRATGLTRAPRKKRAKVPGTVAREVSRRSRGRCIVCGKRPRRPTRHHVLPVRDFPELEIVAANLVLICWEPCHANHETAHRRIQWGELPTCAITLAYSTSGAAAVFLERTYPR